MWWLSFADDDGFRGACIVHGETLEIALVASHQVGCNPGGEVMGVELPPESARLVRPERLGVLLDLKACEAVSVETDPAGHGGLVKSGELLDDHEHHNARMN
jgi:hypothetical protein